MPYTFCPIHICPIPSMNSLVPIFDIREFVLAAIMTRSIFFFKWSARLPRGWILRSVPPSFSAGTQNKEIIFRSNIYIQWGSSHAGIFTIKKWRPTFSSLLVLWHCYHLHVRPFCSQLLYYVNHCTFNCCWLLEVTLSDQVMHAFLSSQPKQKTKAIKEAYPTAEDEYTAVLTVSQTLF